jgi:hypothetical protein
VRSGEHEPTEDVSEEPPLSVEEHLRKALAYADGIRSISNLAAEDENLPKFETPYEVFDWVFEVVQRLERHLTTVKGTLTADCLNQDIPPSADAEDADWL